MKQALKQLLDALDEVSKTHAEVSDTAVRKVMAVAIHRGFVLGEKGYKLPAKFAMFSETGNHLVREALAAFLAHPNAVFSKNRTPDARLAAFQDTSVTSSLGHCYDDYFDDAESVQVSETRRALVQKLLPPNDHLTPYPKKKNYQVGDCSPFRCGQKASVWNLWRALNVGNAWGISLARCAYRRHP